jgi:DNA-binding IclR family transcriptional regulator
MPARGDDAAAQHVVRTLRALELFAAGTQTQADVARALAVHRRTARRLIGRLAEEGYLEAEPGTRHIGYRATPRLVVLGREVAEGLDLVEIGRRHLAEISNDQASVRFIAVRTPDGISLPHFERLELDGGVVDPDVLTQAPAHASAIGKIFLSSDSSLLEEALRQDLVAFTSKTLVTRADLLLELAAIRAQNYALEDGEHHASIRAAASGVVDHAGVTVAVLGAIPAPEEDLTTLGLSLHRSANAFSAEIGAAGVHG